MSIYKDLTPKLPCYRVDAGWNQQHRSFFLQAYDTEEARKPKPFLELGLCDSQPLSHVYDLINYSWSLVDWQQELPVLRQLIVDPILEDHRLRAKNDFTSAQDDQREDISKLVRLAYQGSKVVDLAAQPQVTRNMLRK